MSRGGTFTGIPSRAFVNFVPRSGSKEKLECFGISHRRVGETGVLGILRGDDAGHFRIMIRGKSVHVSTPQLRADALYIASHAVVALQSLVTRLTSPVEPVIIGVGKLTAGTTYNAPMETAGLGGRPGRSLRRARRGYGTWFPELSPASRISMAGPRRFRSIPLAHMRIWEQETPPIPIHCCQTITAALMWTRKYIRAKTREELDEKVLQAQILVKSGVDICGEETFGYFAQMWFDIYKKPYLRAHPPSYLHYSHVRGGPGHQRNPVSGRTQHSGHEAAGLHPLRPAVQENKNRRKSTRSVEGTNKNFVQLLRIRDSAPVGEQQELHQFSLKRPCGPKARNPLRDSQFIAQKFRNTFATKQPQMAPKHDKIREARQGKNSNRKTLKPLPL